MNPGYFEMVSHGGREDVPNFLSRDEQRTIMTLWAIARCPLMFGGHLPASDAWTLSLITNPEVLAIDQREPDRTASFSMPMGLRRGRRRTRHAARSTSRYSIRATGERRGTEPGLAVPVHLADLGLAGNIVVTDVWTGKEVGIVSGTFAPVVPFHGAGLFRMSLAR